MGFQRGCKPTIKDSGLAKRSAEPWTGLGRTAKKPAVNGARICPSERAKSQLSTFWMTPKRRGSLTCGRTGLHSSASQVQMKCAALEMRCRATYRGFESHPLRHSVFPFSIGPNRAGFALRCAQITSPEPRVRFRLVQPRGPQRSGHYGYPMLSEQTPMRFTLSSSGGPMLYRSQARIFMNS